MRLTYAVNRSSKSGSSTTIYAALACAIFVRALIPVGYMPGNLLEGEFVRLCPTGLTALAARDGHADHHLGQGEDEISADSELSSVCPLGAALGQAGLFGAQPGAVTAAGAAGLPAPATEEISPTPPGAAFRSRGPPPA